MKGTKAFLSDCKKSKEYPFSTVLLGPVLEPIRKPVK
jgi:hypothetical protein